MKVPSQTVRIATLIATVVLGAGVVSAQSLGDAARQERMRRAGLEKHSRVLTNEDLSREQILPQNKEEAAPVAKSAPQPPRAEAPAPVLSRAVPVGQGTRWEAPEISLGQYARALRAERARREAATVPAAVAEAKAEPAARVEAASGMDSGVPAWTASEQPNFSLGEYARAQRALRRKDVPIQLTLDAKATPPAVAAPALKPAPAMTASQRPKSSPTRPAVAAAPSAATIVVKSGDSLWKLSRAHLGEGRLWTAIWAANPQVHNPDRIHPGQSLNRPTEVQLAAARRAVSGSRMVVATLNPTPRTGFRSARLHAVKMTAAGKGGARAALWGPAIGLDRLADSESYNGMARKIRPANRSVASISPGRGGLQ